MSKIAFSHLNLLLASYQLIINVLCGTGVGTVSIPVLWLINLPHSLFQQMKMKLHGKYQFSRHTHQGPFKDHYILHEERKQRVGICYVYDLLSVLIQ